MLGYPELLEDPRFNSMGGRLMHMDQVMEVLKNPRKEYTIAEAMSLLTAAIYLVRPALRAMTSRRMHKSKQLKHWRLTRRHCMAR